jgi:hypothetical protein
LRKSLLVAATATLALCLPGVANAQTPPAPSIESSASVSPSKAGTKSKPKAEKLKLSVKNNAESKTTAAKITITFPSTLKISTKGLDQCTASDQEIIDDINVCKKSIAGTGSASAVLNPFAPTPGPLNFKVVPIVGKNQILFALSGSATAVLHGKISGKKMTIVITPQLQQPVDGVFSALNELGTTISKKKGKNSLITSTGCKSKKHVIGVSIGYVGNPNPPAASSASKDAEAKCK